MARCFWLGRQKQPRGQALAPSTKKPARGGQFSFSVVSSIIVYSVNDFWVKKVITPFTLFHFIFLEAGNG